MSPDARAAAEALQEQIVGFIRAFGLHQPDRTPCGQPVPVSEAHALHELHAAGELGQLELGRRLRLEKSTVSRLVGSLVAKGWVERRPDPADGRAARLMLTPAGLTAAADLAAARSARFAELLAAIPDADRDRVIDAFAILRRSLDDRH
jgi:DNA-binding MarR family transcriptional regulator